MAPLMVFLVQRPAELVGGLIGEPELVLGGMPERWRSDLCAVLASIVYGTDPEYAAAPWPAQHSRT